jgi:hypothetical protein
LGYEYFYIVFSSATGFGATVVPQVRPRGSPVDALAVPTEFDIVAAYKILLETQGPEVILISWKPITPAQFLEFRKFLLEVSEKKAMPGKVKHLKAVSLKDFDGPAIS